MALSQKTFDNFLHFYWSSFLLLYFFGFSHFIFLFYAVALIVYLLHTQKKSQYFLLFLVILLFSLLFVENSKQLLVGFRNVLTHFLFMYLLLYANTSLKIIPIFNRIIIIFSSAIILVSVFIMMDTNVGLKLGLYYLLPQSIIENDTVGSILTTVLYTSQTISNFKIYRPLLFFMNENFTLYSFIIMSTLGIYYKSFLSNYGRRLLFISIPLLLLLTIVSTGRGVYIAFSISVFFLLYRNKKLFIGALLLVLILALINYSLIIDFLKNIVDLFNLRTGGDLGDRSNVYLTTYEYFLKKPIFGQGAQLEVEGFVSYPLGSHSYWLGVLFMYGLFGFSIFLFLWTRIVKRTYKLLNRKDRLPFINLVLIVFFIMFFENIEYDIVYLMVVVFVFMFFKYISTVRI